MWSRNRVFAPARGCLRRGPAAWSFFVLALGLLAFACSEPAEDAPERRADPPAPARVDAALRAGVSFLVAQQDEDGAWRSRTYGALRSGLALTPLVLKVLSHAGPVPGALEARARGLAFMRRFLVDGRVAPSFRRGPYPVYAASLMVLVSQRLEDELPEGEVRAWLEEVRSHQLLEPLGWEPRDPAYGGFGYSREPPRKPAEGRPPYDADLSSTLFALGALRVAGLPASDPSVRGALIFVRRCQNFDPGGSGPEADGGFFFTPTNALQNKAGVVDGPASSGPRFRSYGTMTADGLRALLRCGLSPSHPRVRAARRWLERALRRSSRRERTADRRSAQVASSERRFSMDPPGRYPPGRASDRLSAAFYWRWSLAHAFRALARPRLQTPDGPCFWPSLLARDLLASQRPDGSWSNAHTLLKEDDPLVATCLALGALSLARAYL